MTLRANRSRFAAIALTLAIAVVLAANARADTAGSVDITVLDASTGKPVPLARVVFYDCASITGYTDERGVARFDSIPAGECRVQVIKRNYKPAVSAAFAIDPVRVTFATVRLAGNTLKTISSVTVTSSSRLSPTDLDATSPQALLHTSLGDALGDLADVLPSDAGLSIDGRDVTQTGVTVDGVPVSGSNGLSGVNADLFGGASVSGSPSNGNLGGSIGLYSLVPTLAFESDLKLAYATGDSSSLRFAERGSAGVMGLVYAHAARGVNAPINGLVFPDASGLTYAHSAQSYSNGDLLKIRLPFSLGHSLTATFFTNNSVSDAYCARISGPLACGFGPGNSSASRSSQAVLAYANHFGAVNFQLSGFSGTSYFGSDFSHRLVNGILSPSASASQSRVTGFTFFADAPAGERHDATLFVQQLAFHDTSSQNNPLFPAGISATSSSTFTSLRLADSYHADSRTTIAIGFGSQRSSGAPANIAADLGVIWRANANDTFRAGYSTGAQGANFYAQQFFSDPQSLSYNCGAQAVVGSGPGDAQGPQDTSSANVSWEHRLRNGRAFASAYREVQHGALAQTIVNATSLVSQFPSGYLTQIAAFAQTPAGCGPNSALIFPADLYLRTSVSGLDRTYEGGTIGIALANNHGIQIAPYLAFERATLGATADPRISNPASIYRAGQQLPNVPFSRWGFVADYKPPRAAWEALFDVQHVSSNNPSNLPAYTTLAAGVSVSTPVGSFSLVGTNLTNQFSGNFASPANAVALPTVGGGSFPTIAQPLAPRSFALLYSSRIGRLGAGNHGAESTAISQQTSVSFSVKTSLFPKTPPASPFEIQASNPSCTAEVARQMQQDFSGLAAFVSDLEKRKSNGLYPATAVPPVVPDMLVKYVRVGTSYALELLPRGRVGVVGLLTCADIHAGTAAELAALHLYEPVQLGPDQPIPMLFQPRAGLYAYIAPQFMLDFGTPKPLPKMPPANPFAITSTCTSADKPLATAVVDDVRGYLAANPKPQKSTAYDWGAIIPHQTARGWYLELALDDVFASNGLHRCLSIFRANDGELLAAGGAGTPLPAVNYDPRFGFYIYTQSVIKFKQPQ